MNIKKIVSCAIFLLLASFASTIFAVPNPGNQPLPKGWIMVGNTKSHAIIGQPGKAIDQRAKFPLDIDLNVAANVAAGVKHPPAKSPSVPAKMTFAFLTVTNIGFFNYYTAIPGTSFLHQNNDSAYNWAQFFWNTAPTRIIEENNNEIAEVNYLSGVNVEIDTHWKNAPGVISPNFVPWITFPNVDGCPKGDWGYHWCTIQFEDISQVDSFDIIVSNSSGRIFKRNVPGPQIPSAIISQSVSQTNNANSTDVAHKTNSGGGSTLALTFHNGFIIGPQGSSVIGF